MKSLIVTALALATHSHAVLEETSLMQGLVARRQLAPDAKSARKDSTTKLMETATKLIKNGATPDVLVFINETMREIEEEINVAIIHEHNIQQQQIYDSIADIQGAVDEMRTCADSIASQRQDASELSETHKLCRSDESLACARSRKCEEELEELWRRVVIEEGEMRRIHWEIHREWCEPPLPPHPGLADPWNWPDEDHWEGPETSQSVHEYPEVNQGDGVIAFRTFSVTYFGLYIEQLPRVEIAWELYNQKLVECSVKEETWHLQVEQCDDLQEQMFEADCLHAATNRDCASNFGQEYHWRVAQHRLLEADVRIDEYERKREWETLHIITCLLNTTYTHVIHSIDSGEPCPTETENEEQTSAEINYCHVIPVNLTRHLDIIYPPVPDPPPLPPVVPFPCTPEYVYETSTFSATLIASHGRQIEAEGLEEYFTLISAYGWAGCAAPIKCIPCEAEEIIPNPDFHDPSMECKLNHGHLHPGQMDFDTFRCLTGNQCIPAAGRCNEDNNCNDGSDETACETPWGIPAVLQAEECSDPFVSELQFRCADGVTCTDIMGKCNGVNNCADGSDEVGCATTTHGVTVEAMTGFSVTMETPELHSFVFSDREYTFDSLGSFTGHSFIKFANEDKHIRHTHVQMKVRLPRPLTIYVAKLDTTELSWLVDEGWSRTFLEGVSYHGVRRTRHTDWSGELNEDFYGPGEVYQKTFPAGLVELRGNNGGDGSFLMFVASPSNQPVPTTPGLPGQDTYIGCFTDDSARDLGPMVGVWQNAATNTYELCRAECQSRGNRFMSLQWGGECFCANEYATADQYYQVDDSNCDVVREPCSPQSHNCGGTWHQAIYEIGNSRYELAAEDTKCPHNHADRLFRDPASGSSAITLEECRDRCDRDHACNHFSYGFWDGAYVCMGCTSLANSQHHSGFTAYNVLRPTALLSRYPGYTGDLNTEGLVTVFGDGELSLDWELTGVDPACATTPAGVANACGVHIHSGMTCDDASMVGGHHHNMASDPWTTVVFNSDADGNANGHGLSISTGYTRRDLVGRAMVVHDHTGARVACGILHVHPTVTANLGSYPGYDGDLQFSGSVAVRQVGDDLTLSWKLRGLEAELCATAPAGVANACGIHIHSGSTCGEASGVGGHYYHSDLSADPWSPVVYTPDGHGDSTTQDYSIGIGQNLADVLGRAIVVHDHTGGRVACGILH